MYALEYIVKGLLASVFMVKDIFLAILVSSKTNNNAISEEKDDCNVFVGMVI